MPSNRFFKLATEAQRRILDVARAEFLQHGYEGASLNQIVQAAGISKGSLYYYFEDKADLFITVLRNAQEELTQSVTGTSTQAFFQQTPGDFWAFMEATSTKKVEYYVNHPNLFRLYTELFRLSQQPGAPASFVEYMEDTHALTRSFLEMGQAQGVVRTDLPLQMLCELILAVSEVMNRRLLDEPCELEGWGPKEIREYALPQIDMLRRMLYVPDGGTKQ